MKAKTCAHCWATKPVGEFYAHAANTTDGLYSYCKECKRRMNREYMRSRRAARSAVR